MPLFDVTKIRSDAGLKIEALFPTLSCWNRLEGSPRARDFSQSLKAAVADPLWMLTRQWQLGEFRAGDTGSPCYAKVQVQTASITAIKGRNGHISRYDANLAPLETLVERRPFRLTYPIRLQIGRYWQKLLRKLAADGKVGADYSGDYLNEYAFQLPARPRQPEDFDALTEAQTSEILATYAHQEVYQWAAAVAGKQIDGGKLLPSFSTTGGPFEKVNVAAADRSELEKAAEEWLEWVNKVYQQPTGPKEDNWAPSQLEYQFKCAVQQPNNTALTLLADNYGQGSLDWYSFDIDPTNEAITPPEPISQTLKTETLTFLPTPAQFSGMPQQRWWAFEDHTVNFANVNAQTTDLLTLLMTDFALMSSNDWFVVPYELPVGSLATVTGLVVTDVFGERTWINAAGQGPDDDWQQWRLFNLNTRGKTKEFASTSLFVPLVVSKSLESKPVEKITFLRDEMANLAWGIESIVELDNGSARNGYEVASEVRKLLEKVYELKTPVERERLADLVYHLQTSTPENWIPFIPTHTGQSKRQIQFQRAGMLRILEGKKLAPSLQALRSRSEILSVGAAEAKPYFIFEEEIPRAGKLVTSTYQRCRDEQGRVFVWKGIKVTTGRGEGASGLEFDSIR